MNTNKMTTIMNDRKVILSTLWVFATLNYIYADVFTLFFNLLDTYSLFSSG